MTPEFTLSFTRHAMVTAVEVAAPMLVAGMVVGLAVALFQAVTQIHEISLTFIPKIAAVALAAYVAAGWMMEVLMGFTKQAFALIPGLGG
ncbi:MAG: flagellar biosynthetic protein FliQ [Deltaproteobacteria bacterium]|nr:MAG: flagellar biosynthetic protein FliQ [Deltaproteobacteria bacterium]